MIDMGAFPPIASKNVVNNHSNVFVLSLDSSAQPKIQVKSYPVIPLKGANDILYLLVRHVVSKLTQSP